MSNLIDVILPVFLIIGFGYLVSWRGMFSESAVDGLMRFAQTFAVPVLLAKSIANLDLSASYDLGLMVSFYTGAFTSFVIGIIGAAMMGRNSSEAVAIGFCCLFGNSLLLGLPITERAYGAGALTANYAIISIHSPLLYTVGGIVAMEAVRARGGKVSLGRVALNALTGVLKTPMVIGIAAGFAIQAGEALSGASLPATVAAAMDMIARAALPAALFGWVGSCSAISRRRQQSHCHGDLPVTDGASGDHLRPRPLVFDLGTPALRSGVLTAAMAPGVNAYLFANIYGVGGGAWRPLPC